MVKEYMTEEGSWKPISEDEEIDNLIEAKEKEKIDINRSEDRVRIANEIKTNPPKPGFMKVDVVPAIYSIDLNIDAHWWFNHVCTVFPLLLDQGIRTHVDIRDSFKPEKRHTDFNLLWIMIIIIGLAGLFLFLSMFGVI